MAPATFAANMGAVGLYALLATCLVFTALINAFSFVPVRIAIAADQKLSVRIAFFFVALFAIFHGGAHDTGLAFRCTGRENITAGFKRASRTSAGPSIQHSPSSLVQRSLSLWLGQIPVR